MRYNGDIKELIDVVIKENIKVLRKNGLLSENTMTPYQKTEKVLYDYNTYKQAVLDKYDKIKEIEQVGLRKKSRSIVQMPQGSPQSLTEEEKEQATIETLKKSIALTERFIALIDEALKKINDDTYYPIIEMIYFKKMMLKDVAEKFGANEKTVRTNKSRLINQLSIHLFSDEVIYRLFQRL